MNTAKHTPAANARLIAAAPKLADELRNARRWILGAIIANVTVPGFVPEEHVAIKRIDAVLTEAGIE